MTGIKIALIEAALAVGLFAAYLQYHRGPVPQWIGTVAVVSITPLFMYGVRLISMGIARLIPPGKFRDIMTKEHGAQAQGVDLASLRSGLK